MSLAENYVRLRWETKIKLTDNATYGQAEASLDDHGNIITERDNVAIAIEKDQAIKFAQWIQAVFA